MYFIEENNFFVHLVFIPEMKSSLSDIWRADVNSRLCGIFQNSTESVEFLEHYFLVLFIFQNNNNSILYFSKLLKSVFYNFFRFRIVSTEFEKKKLFCLSKLGIYN